MSGLSALVYGGPKSGKSFFGDTTPAPRLVLDAEAGSRFTPSIKKKWDPSVQAPPEADGTWSTALVEVRDYVTVKRAYEWLNSGQHPFKSVVLDSISEIQQKCIDNLVGINPMKLDNWGQLLREIGDLVRSSRDLLTHPTNPLEAVVLIAMAKDNNGRFVPYAQGQLGTSLPFYPDIVGYLANRADDAQVLHRYLMLQPSDQWIAGERVGGKLGPWLENPNMQDMINSVFGSSDTPEKNG